MRRAPHFVILTTLLATVMLAATLPTARAAIPSEGGWVVDQAGVLSDATEVALIERLRRHERETTNQVVVVTLRSLDDHTIEDVGFFITYIWGVGQADLNNGVVFVIVPDERKMRIEVGDGLKGYLTDAEASSIIRNVVRPHFGRNEFDAGVTAGVEAIIEQIEGAYGPNKKTWIATWDAVFVFAIILLVLGFMIFDLYRTYRHDRNTPGQGPFYLGGGDAGGSDHGGHGGGFSGGSFGGGASGGW